MKRCASAAGRAQIRVASPKRQTARDSPKRDPLRESIEAKCGAAAKASVDFKYEQLEEELRRNLKKTAVLEPQILPSSVISPVKPDLSRTEVITPHHSTLEKARAPAKASRKFSPVSKKSTNTSIN